jgi:hypothetical protein
VTATAISGSFSASGGSSRAAGRVNVDRGAVGVVISCMTRASRAVNDSAPTDLGHAQPASSDR